MIESIRKDGQSVLLLDCGAVFDNIRDKAELLLNAMELMGYDALNLGGPEFAFGKEFLEHTRSHASFPYIASNLLYDSGRLPWTKEYIIKDMGGIKVAILGVLNPDDLKQVTHQAYVKGLEVIRPETTLGRLLPEVKAKADLVILLSRFGVEKTRALVNAVKGIDVAISSGSDGVFFVEPLEGTALLQTGSLGKTIGLLKIALDEKGAPRVSESRYISMPRSVPDDERIARLVEGFKNAKATKEEKARGKTQKELMGRLQLTPEQFMERYRKEQTDMRNGEPR